MKKLIGFILMVFGSALEVYYYYARFHSEGSEWYWAAIQGVALTALLLGFFLLARSHSRWWLVPAFLLALYSIANTSAGQRQALVEKSNSEIMGPYVAKIEAIEAIIERKQNRYDTVTALIDTSITDFDDYWEWQNTTEKYETEQKDLLTEIDGYRTEIAAIEKPTMEASSNMQIYSFWGGVFDWSNIDLIQLIMQVIFSSFVAVMAPVGALMISDDLKKRERKERFKRFLSLFERKEKYDNPDPTEEPEAFQDPIEEIEPVIEPVEIPKLIKEPDPVPEILELQEEPIVTTVIKTDTNFNGMSKISISNTIKMLTSSDYPNKLMHEKEAHERFKKLNAENPRYTVISEENCKMVKAWIFSSNLFGTLPDEIYSAALIALKRSGE